MAYLRNWRLINEKINLGTSCETSLERDFQESDNSDVEADNDTKYPTRGLQCMDCVSAQADIHDICGQSAAQSEILDSDVLPLSSSESECDISEEEDLDVKRDLSQWIVKSQCSRELSNELLLVLRKYGHDLPKDVRTLLKSLCDINIINKCGGQYTYFGI